MRVGGQRHSPTRKDPSPPVFDSRTVQPVTSRDTDWAVMARTDFRYIYIYYHVGETIIIIIITHIIDKMVKNSMLDMLIVYQVIKNACTWSVQVHTFLVTLGMTVTCRYASKIMTCNMIISLLGLKTYYYYYYYYYYCPCLWVVL